MKRSTKPSGPPVEVNSDEVIQPIVESQPVVDSSGAGSPANDAASPNKRRQKHSGGPAFHKPGCICRPCSARRREAEAIALGAGSVDVPVPRDNLPAPTQKPLTDLVPADAAPSKMRANVAAWLKAKSANSKLTNKEIAESIGISASTMHASLYKARKEGWLRFEDPLNEFRYGMVPKIAENLNLFLDARDKQVTLEAAKATIFRQYAVEEGIAEAAPVTVLALKIEMPPGFVAGSTPANLKGVIVGTPVGFIEGEIVADKPDPV